MLSLVFGPFFAQELYGHQDGVQEVVEVVGDAAGQNADAFQTLRAQQLGLKLYSLGHICIDDQNALGLAVVVATRVQRVSATISRPSFVSWFQSPTHSPFLNRISRASSRRGEFPWKSNSMAFRPRASSARQPYRRRCPCSRRRFAPPYRAW